MKRIFIKIITIIFLFIIANISTFAIDSEFKNTLTNVDLIKTSQNSYTVNLYTSKKYSAPVKVIKKSDLSYYILLPETKNITPAINLSSPDIRNVKTTLYPYAGVDVNNGYTKVDITTTKPIIFNVVTKSATQQVASNKQVAPNASSKNEPAVQKNTQAPKVVENKPTSVAKEQKPTVAQKQIVAQKPQTDTKNEIKAEPKKEAKNQPIATVVSKKNTIATAQKTVEKQNNTAKTENIKKDIPKKAEKPAPAVKVAKNTVINNVNKKDAKPVINKKIEEKLKKLTAKQHTPKVDEKPKQEPVIREAMAAAKVEPEVDNTLETVEETQPIEQTEENKTEELIEDTVIPEIVPEEVTNEEIPEEEKVVSKNIDFAPFFGKIKNGIKNTFVGIGSAFSAGTSSLSDKLHEYGLSIFDLLFMIFAGVFSFVAVLFILSKKQNEPKLKNKSELMDKTEPSLVPKKETNKDKEDNKYFVFENNVKQTGLTIPAEDEEKKNYELVSYDPDIRINPNKSDTDNNEDLDIIQKILKDDDFVDIQKESGLEEENINIMIASENMESNPKEEEIMPQEQVMAETKTIQKTEQEQVVEPVREPIKQNESVTSPIGAEHIQPVRQEEIVEDSTGPRLLASYNISPDCGFMFISYNNNVNLMGFIFDEVFNLHNYKTSKLDSYNLQYRLVDKDEKNDVYIVKTDGAKLLVKVSKTSMNTEIML